MPVGVHGGLEWAEQVGELGQGRGRAGALVVTKETRKRQGTRARKTA